MNVERLDVFLFRWGSATVSAMCGLCEPGCVFDTRAYFEVAVDDGEWARASVAAVLGESWPT